MVVEIPSAFDKVELDELWREYKLSSARGSFMQKAALTYGSVDGTNDDEARHNVEYPEQRSERAQTVSLELYARVMEADCNEGEHAKGGHLEDESCD
jgi:hypothetical protein